MKQKNLHMITISGPDGCGKSTLIDQVKAHFQGEGREVKVIRSRPLGFPLLSYLKYGKRAGLIASTTKHYNKRQYNKFSSIIKFSYYFLDYLVGCVFLKYYKLMGILVVFDRYYFDYICNAERFSLDIPTKMTRFLYKFVYKADVNIFLDAEPSEILVYKQEQLEEQIIVLNIKYRTLFEELATCSSEGYKIIKAHQGIKTYHDTKDAIYA